MSCCCMMHRQGYGCGVFAPGKRDTDGRGSYLAAHHQLLAHSAACKAFRTRHQAAEKQVTWIISRSHRCFFFVVSF